MRTVRISEEVYEEIAKLGKFGESVDDVLRKVFNIEKASSTTSLRRSTGGSMRIATIRQTAVVKNGELIVKYEGGNDKSWRLPSKEDKNRIRAIRDDAVRFAIDNEATEGQVNAVKKALTDAGYHLIK